ncbi:MAG TPA: hypothetical protein VGC01_06690 [Mucilaginibacter sp.]
MVKSVLSKIKKNGLFLSIILVAAVSYCFNRHMDEQEMLTWGNKCLMQSFDASTDTKLKKWELELTPDAFVRMRKIYQNGKQEYFSLHLHRLTDINYLGTADAGTLQLQTIADDIIVQTHNDRKGDLDTLATMLNIPVKNMQPERLDSLRTVLEYFKAKDL